MSDLKAAVNSFKERVAKIRSDLDEGFINETEVMELYEQARNAFYTEKSFIFTEIQSESLDVEDSIEDIMPIEVSPSVSQSFGSNSTDRSESHDPNESVTDVPASKRVRYARVRYDPLKVVPMQASTKYTISVDHHKARTDITHPKIEAFEILRGFGWKKVNGFGAHINQSMIVNPVGKKYKKKHHPVEGVDFFADQDVQKALDYVRRNNTNSTV